MKKLTVLKLAAVGAALWNSRKELPKVYRDEIHAVVPVKGKHGFAVAAIQMQRPAIVSRDAEQAAKKLSKKRQTVCVCPKRKGM